MSTNIGTVLAAGVSQNNLINGKMAFECDKLTSGLPCKDGAGISKFRFTPGKKHLLRLINAGAEGQQRFSIDEHEMTVIAHDFVPVKPYKVTDLSLGIGQRADVIVKANAKLKKSYFMRASIQTDCTGSEQPDALAVIYYPGADQNALPTSVPQNNTMPDCHASNYPLAKTTPVFPIKVRNADFVKEIDIGIGQNATGHWLWTMNDVSFRANFNNPILLLANKGNTSYPENWNVINTQNSKVVRIILRNRTGARHPMHLHGHNMQELASGSGLEWDGKITNPKNPARRDTHVIEGNGHYVFQYETDNPGVWPFHCHIAWHVSGGLYVNLMEQVTKIKKNMRIPQIMHQTCRDWARYTNTTVGQYSPVTPNPKNPY